MWEKLRMKLRAIFSAKTANALFRAITRAAPYYWEAVQVTIWILNIVGKEKTAAGIARLAEKVGLDVGSRNPDEAMMLAAVKLLRERFPDAKLADLKRAVELAVGTLDD